MIMTRLAITFKLRWTLRQLMLLCIVLVGFSANTKAEDVFRLMLEEPINGEIHGGVGNLRGWAVASEGIEKVEIFIDGEYAFDAPYGGARGDVGGAFPEVPDADQSGFSSAYAYSLLSSGTHTIKALAHTRAGTTKESAATFEVVKFKQAFISDPDAVDLTGTSCSVRSDEISVGNAQVDGDTYDVLLDWRTAEQGFEIVKVGSKGSSGQFVYQSQCTRDLQGNEVCFSAEQAGYRTEFVGPAGVQETAVDAYGTIQVQSLVGEWPEGEVSTDSAGNMSYGNMTYDGYLQNRTFDSLNFSSLDAMSKAGQWAALAVVQVYADRCMINVNGTVDWNFAAMPRTGFFIAPDLIVTDAVVAINLEEDPSGGKFWMGGAAPNPETVGTDGQRPMTCTEAASAIPGATIEVGAGPVVQTFDGTWGAGTVVASGEHMALIKLTRGTKNSRQYIDDWPAWDSVSKDIELLKLEPANAARKADALVIHHPEAGRGAGGWHLTTGDIISGCDAFSDLSFWTGNATDAFAVDFWSDEGSLGAPIIDDKGYVVGMIKGEKKQSPDECRGIVSTGKNTLGVLDTFFADPNSVSVAIGAETLRAFVADYDSQHIAISTSTPPEVLENKIWPSSANTLANANFEVIDYGEDFTMSGFPKAELTSTAFDIAKAATLMYVKANGCETCEAGDITDDFSDTCICTGFAVTQSLIIVNDHCVTELFPGDQTTFKTFQGQVVSATLVQRSGLDTGGLYEATVTEGTGLPNPIYRGDVALLRTDYPMDLTPVAFADSSLMNRRQPLITVGHPAIMLRSGPYVTSGGAFIGHDFFDGSTLHYTLPANSGSSGSGVFDLQGRLVGQIAYGGAGYQSAQSTWVISEYDQRALEVQPSAVLFGLEPRPFLVGPRVQIQVGQSTSGASSNYIKDLINYWAPDASIP